MPRISQKSKRCLWWSPKRLPRWNNSI